MPEKLAFPEDQVDKDVSEAFWAQIDAEGLVPEVLPPSFNVEEDWDPMDLHDEVTETTVQPQDEALPDDEQ